MTFTPWEALLAGVLLAEDKPARTRQSYELPGPVDISWQRDFLVTMRLCRATARGDRAAVAAELHGKDPRALLANAVGLLVAFATVAVENGVASDVEGIFAMWTAQAGLAP